MVSVNRRLAKGLQDSLFHLRLELSPPAVVLLILGVVLLTFAIFNLLVAVMVKQITSLASDSKDF